ncbi:hypothetical protein [Rhizohabitans arisaemae]|uniref:hypothetical protein n=1 Tax=Rhizohabitans arisaemae TaxID=2720610 RepID=UPI0024B1D367|nr:hypothetical protein [Rhizohabitans arisaemae]
MSLSVTRRQLLAQMTAAGAAAAVTGLVVTTAAPAAAQAPTLPAGPLPNPPAEAAECMCDAAKRWHSIPRGAATSMIGNCSLHPWGK